MVTSHSNSRKHAQEQEAREQWEMIGYLNYDVDAEIVSSLFESKQIPMLIQGRNHRRMLGFIGGYIQMRVLVPLTYREEGIALLEEYFKQKENHEFKELTEEEQQGEQSFLWFSATSRKLGIALFLSLFLGFGLSSWSAGLRIAPLFIAPLQLCAYWAPGSEILANILSLTPETYASNAKIYLPLLDLLLSWSYIFYQVVQTKSSK